MSGRIVRFPDRGRRKRDNRRRHIVPCEMSTRWLQFAKQIDRHADMSYLHIDIMTLSQAEKPRKLCDFVLDADELKTLLGMLPIKDWTRPPQ